MPGGMLSEKCGNYGGENDTFYASINSKLSAISM